MPTFFFLLTLSQPPTCPQHVIVLASQVRWATAGSRLSREGGYRWCYRGTVDTHRFCVWCLVWSPAQGSPAPCGPGPRGDPAKGRSWDKAVAPAKQRGQASSRLAACFPKGPCPHPAGAQETGLLTAVCCAPGQHWPLQASVLLCALTWLWVLLALTWLGGRQGEPGSPVRHQEQPAGSCRAQLFREHIGVPPGDFQGTLCPANWLCPGQALQTLLPVAGGGRVDVAWGSGAVTSCLLGAAGRGLPTVPLFVSTG